MITYAKINQYREFADNLYEAGKTQTADVIYNLCEEVEMLRDRLDTIKKGVLEIAGISTKK